jgi:hypothetical protein
VNARSLFKLWWVPALAVVFGAVTYWFVAMHRIVHDKAINADALQRVWSYGRAVPLGTVIPPHNRWTDDAFVAEASDEEAGRTTSVLILDDHYRGSDPTYRTESGVIGNDVSISLLCSLPAQASTEGVRLDPVVVRLVQSRCRSVG